MFDAFRQLTQLWLNNISHIDIGTIKNISNLVWLHLEYNQLNILQYGMFEDLGQLVMLH